MKRRAFLASAGSLATASLAGCLDSKPTHGFEFSASPVTVTPFLREQTGLTDVTTNEVKVTQPVEFQGDRLDVTFREWTTRFEDPVVSENHLWTVLFNARPNPRIDGETLNPQIEREPGPFLRQLSDEWPTVQVDVQSAEHTVDLLGSSVSVSEYEIAMEHETHGVVSAVALMGRTVSANETVTAVGLYDASAGDYTPDIFTMFQGAQHPADPPSATPAVTENETAESANNTTAQPETQPPTEPRSSETTTTNTTNTTVDDT